MLNNAPRVSLSASDMTTKCEIFCYRVAAGKEIKKKERKGNEREGKEKKGPRKKTRKGKEYINNK
jgi:hypothetical protein